MEGSTAKTNIDNLIHLGFTTKIQSQRWYSLFKKRTNAKCMGCNNKIRVTSPISKLLGLKYFSHRYIPEVHWVLDFKLQLDESSIKQCKDYIKTLHINEKKEHIYPCCYKCWDIAVNIKKDYSSIGINEYYTNLSVTNKEYVNWSSILLENCKTDEHRKLKLNDYYDYISNWCKMIGYCSYTEDGLKYCSKQNGKCIHTNSNYNSLLELEKETLTSQEHKLKMLLHDHELLHEHELLQEHELIRNNISNLINPTTLNNPSNTTQTVLSNPLSNPTQTGLSNPSSNPTQTGLSNPSSNPTQTVLSNPSSNPTQTFLSNPSSNLTQTVLSNDMDINDDF